MEHADDRNLVGCLIDFADDKVRQPYHDPFIGSAGPACTTTSLSEPGTNSFPRLSASPMRTKSTRRGSTSLSPRLRRGRRPCWRCGPARVRSSLLGPFCIRRGGSKSATRRRVTASAICELFGGLRKQSLSNGSVPRANGHFKVQHIALAVLVDVGRAQIILAVPSCVE
jgi:hypothetical protein